MNRRGVRRSPHRDKNQPMRVPSLPSIRLRRGQPGDFKACLPLISQLWPQVRRPQQVARVFGRLCSEPNCCVLVAESGDRVVGFLDLSLRPTLFHRGWTAIIEDLIVDKAWRRQGIGSLLVHRGEQYARKRGCRGIELSSDLGREAAHRFWSSLGYECLARQFRKELT